MVLKVFERFKAGLHRVSWRIGPGQYLYPQGLRW
jgi:hypothetical protein